jgi:hypothetical protein
MEITSLGHVPITCAKDGIDAFVIQAPLVTIRNLLFFAVDQAIGSPLFASAIRLQQGADFARILSVHALGCSSLVIGETDVDNAHVIGCDASTPNGNNADCVVFNGNKWRIIGSTLSGSGTGKAVVSGLNGRNAVISDNHCDNTDINTAGGIGTNFIVGNTGVGTVSAHGTDVVLQSAGGGGGAPTNATYVTLSTDATLTNERMLAAGSGITIVDGGAGSTVTISASGGGATLTAATITVPFGLQAQTATVVDAGATAASKVMVTWGNTANTDENQPSATNVTFSAVGAAGQVLITVSSNNHDNVGGAYKVLYILG